MVDLLVCLFYSPLMSRKKSPKKSATWPNASHHAKPNFEVEQMEQRLLLTANLYQPVDPSGSDPAASTNSVQQKLSEQLTNTFNQLGNLGDSLNGEFNGKFSDMVVPLVDKTLDDVIGTDIGDFFKFAAGNQDIQGVLNGVNPDSNKLALSIQAALFDFDLSGTVSDDSTDFGLNLLINIGDGRQDEATDIRLGESEEELNLRIEAGTQVEVDTSRNLSFRIMADLSSLQNGATLADQVNGLTDNKFWIDLFGNEGLSVNASALHTSTTNILPEFGVQVGILGMQEGGTGAGAYAFTGTDFRLDVTGEFSFNDVNGDNRLDLGEMKGFQSLGNWGDAHTFSTPTDGTKNSAEVIMQVGVESDANADTHIGGITGVTGTVTFNDNDLFDNRAPMATTDGTLASFSRLTSQDILNMAGGVSGWASALQASGIYGDNVPFLDIETGDAYAFGKAFQEVFLAQLQNVEQVLSARNAPSTWNGPAGSLVQNPLDYSGSTQFLISINGAAWQTVTLANDPARNTLEELAADLTAALPTGVEARVRETNSPRLEIFSANDETEFVLTQFQPKAAGRLDLGFDVLQQLVLANDATAAFGGAITESSQLQTPGIIFEPTAAVDLSDLTGTPKILTVAINGETPVSITIPSFAYADLDTLSVRLRDLFSANGILDSTNDSGVFIETFASEDGREGLRFHGGSDVHSLQFGGTAATALNLSTAIQSSRSFDITVTTDAGNETYRVFLPGNLTSSILGDAANSTINDYVDDLRFAMENTAYLVAGSTLTKKRLLNDGAATGIDVRGALDAASGEASVQFFARNPGNETGQITGFSLNTAGFIGNEVGFTESVARPFVSGDIAITPNFDSVQEFAQRIANSPVDLSAGITPSWNTNTLTFTFPVEFDYAAPPLVDDPATTEEDERIAVDLATGYDHVSNLVTDSEVEVTRETTSRFDFEFSLKPLTRSVEQLSVDIPVLVYDWDGKLENDAVFTVVLDDGVEHDLIVTADDASLNIEIEDFVAQLNTALQANAAIRDKVTITLGLEADTETPILSFTTVTAETDSRILQVHVRPEVASALETTNAAVDVLGFTAGKTNFTSVADELIAATTPTSFTLSRDAILEVALFDGNVGTVYLDSSETSDNTSLADLIEDLNFAIDQSAALSTFYDGLKLEAFENADGKLGFRLNATLFPDDGSYTNENWSIEVFPVYRQPSPNGASLELDLPERSTDVAGRAVPVTALSGSLTGSDAFNLLSPATLLISVNGSDYASVVIGSGSLGATLGDLIADVNAALAATNVTVGGSGFALSDFVLAAMNDRGDGFAIRSLDLAGTTTPEVITMRVMADGDVANNSAITQLGFEATEQRAGWRGGEAFLDNVSLSGSASVTGQQVTATGMFGFAEFEAADGSLDLRAASTTLLRDGARTRFSLFDLNDLVTADAMDTVSITNVDPSTFVTLVLSDLSFTGTSVDGLAFDTGATITISHALTSTSADSSIQNFALLPTADVTYFNTAGMENLSNLLFDDIFQGLLRSAEFISDQMRIDPDGSGAAVNPYETSLLFIKESLVGQFDFGYEFETMIAQMADAPPATLQDLQQVISDSLQVDLADVEVTLATSYDVNSEMTEASVEIKLPFVKTFAVALPLFIDLAQLRNRSSDPAIVKAYLAGLDALASTITNPMNVDLSVLSDLNLDLAINVVDDSEQVTPRAILKEATTVDTHFNLAGANFNGDLPVGNARFRLSEGQVAINATGEAQVNDEFNTEKLYNELALTPDYVPPVMLSVAASTTVDLGGTYTAASGTLTASQNGALIVDGVTVNVGDRVLVNNQEDDSYVVADSSWVTTEEEKNQNGVYRVVSTGSATSGWSLVRDVAANSAAELNGLYVTVTGGENYAGRDFLQTVQIANAGTDTKSFSKLIDPAKLSINLNQDFQLPYAVDVATTSQLDGVYAPGGNPGNPAEGATLTSAGNASLNNVTSTLASGRSVAGIDGVTDLQVGDLILLKDQLSNTTEGNIEFQNGVYRVVDLGAEGSNGSQWVLERAAFADETSEFSELRVASQLGRDNGRTAFVQDNATLGSISAGQSISFNSLLNRVYAEFNSSTLTTEEVATITPDGQAQAYLPIVIVVTGEDGVERIISKDTSQFTEAQANDADFMALQPDFDPINIRVVSDELTGRSGLDRFFDISVPSNVPGVPAPVVFFSNPDLPQDELNPFYLNIPPVDVLQILRDPFTMGESLDLALFNLQFAIDQALGNELPLLGLDLPSYTIFIESWRSDFTNSLRDNLRNNKLKPINATIDSLFEALGPGGAGYLTSRAQIRVETLDSSETATVWDPNDPDNYDLTPANEEFEITPGSAVSLQFALDLVKEMDTDATEVNIAQIYMPDELGLEVDTATQRLDSNFNAVDTTGGVNLRTAFTLHLGFGVDLTDGFYLYNPVDDGVSEAEAVMSIDVQAVLDGDLATAGVQAFTQGERTSTLHLLNVQVADALTVPGGVRPTDATADDQGASGIYSTYEFFLNTGSGGENNNRTTVPDMQIRNTLGLDPTVTIPGVSLSALDYGIISFDTHGDTDINLLIEGGKPGEAVGGDGGIPDIQTEFYFQARYGEGSDRLSYVTQAVYDAAKAAVAAGNATELQQSLAAQPDFRIMRELIDGAVFDFLNITVDAEEFLKGTIFEMLIKFSEGIAPIRPILDFLLTPVPGTEWMAEPFVVGEFLGPKFLIFIRTLSNVDNTIRALGEGIGFAEAKPDWAKPRVSLTTDGTFGVNTPRVIGGIARSVGIKTDYGKKSPLTLERERIQKYVINRRVDAYQKKLDRAERAFNNLKEPTSDRAASRSLRDAFNEKVTTPNKFSKKFETFRDKGFAKSEGTGRSTKFVNKIKESANRGLAGNDDRGGRKSPIANVSGGGFRLDYLKIENIHNILLGKEANLSFLELPNIELGVAYSRSFPLPAFPPLQLTIGANFSIRTHLKFGWDTQGFYWSTLDLQGKPSPAFGITVGFSVGVALNFGLIEAGVQAFFTLDLDFNWNDVTVPKDTTRSSSAFGRDLGDSNENAIGYGKLRGSQIDFLKSLDGADGKMGNLFDVTLTGRVGLTFYVDLTIPIPFVGPIVKRILSKTFTIELFKVTFYAEKPGIQLGAVSGGTLTLHMGEQFAGLRLFGDTTARNEVFTLESHGTSGSGESVQIHAVLQGQNFSSDIFHNVQRIRGFAGGGQSVIDASDLIRATVDFTGGSGNSILKAGAAAGSVLRGGSGTSTLTGAASASTTLLGGQGNTTIYGGTAADTIRSGQRSDLLVGGGGGDTYQFVDNFGRDRLFATGANNIADFSGVTNDLTFNLGRLVQSAKEGNNTIFFAPDVAGLNSIDTWIAGSGDDRFNTFYFAPNKTLNIQGGGGDNFYSITLGNQFKRFFADTNPGADTLIGRMDPRNLGYINIVDTGGNGHALIKQAFPERINYNIESVSNGREQVTMSGITRADLDAGDATVIWGDPSQRWIDLGVGSTVTAGTIEMRSNVEAEGLTLNLKRSFSITKALNLRNNSDATITIQNLDPLASANLFLGSNRAATDPWLPGIYSSAGSVFTTPGVDPGLVAPDGNGTGLIRIETPTGGVLDGSDGAARAGVIQAANGEVVIEARDTVGYAANQVVINARYFAASTTKAVSTDAEGINVISDQDLHVTLVDGVNGLSTVSGRIELTVAGGNTLYYGNVTAGAGRDIIFNADTVEESAGRQYEVLRDVLVPVDVTSTFTYYVAVTYRIFWPWHNWFNSWRWFATYTVIEPRTFTVTSQVLRLQEQLVTETLPAGGTVTTTGDVYFRNTTDNLAVRVGDTVSQANTLNVTEDILNSISDSARTIIIGRNGDEAIRTGKAQIMNQAFSQGLILKGSEIDLLGTGAARLSSTSRIELQAYESNGTNAGDGSIHFANSANPIDAPTLLATAFRDIRIDTDLSSSAANGLVQLTAGSGISKYGGADNTGSIILDSTASLEAASTGGALILASGITGGNLDLDGTIEAANSISVQARGGSILMDAGAVLETNRLEALAKFNTVLRTNVNTITRAEVLGSGATSGDSLTIQEFDGVELITASTDAGNITIETGGLLELGEIDATSDFNVTINSDGGVSGFDLLPAVNITADSLFVTAGGDISLATTIENLTATTTSAGSITIDDKSGLGSTLNVDSISTADGLVLVDAEGNLIVDSIVSNTSSSQNSISLNTRNLFGGNIIVDEIDAGSLGSVSFESGTVSASSQADSGGVIQSKAGGTGRVTANDLTALAGGFADDPATDVINLRTNVADLIARALTGGDPDAADSRADIVIDEANDIRLRWISTLEGDIDVTAGGDIVHQSVSSPNRDITLTAGGSVTAQLDEALNDGVVDLPAKLLGRNLNVTAQDEISINTTVDRLIVESQNAGNLTVTESDSALFESIKTADGDISLTAGEFDAVNQAITKGGNSILGIIQAGTNGTDNVTIASYGQTRTSGQQDDGGNLLPGDTVVANAKITAALLEVASYGRLDLLTDIDRLIADNFQIGNIEIVEDDALVIQNLTSTAGSITVTTDGTITAHFIESKDDLAQADTFDVNLHAQSGDVLVDQITVGTAHNDIRITADLGNIEEIDPQDQDDSFDAPSTAGLDLIADRAILNAQGSIGGIRPLETRLNSLEATSNTAGNIDLNEHDSITLTQVSAADGNITIDAGGWISAINVESLTDDDGNDIRIHNTDGDILVDRISAGATAGDLFLDADNGKIEELGAGDAGDDLIADHAILNANQSIGGDVALETEFNSLEAHAGTTGNIDLNEKDAIILDNIDTADGSITLDAGGTITAHDVESSTDADANDISLHNTNGDILFDRINAGANDGDVFLTSDAGRVEEFAQDDPDIDLIADNAIINAGRSIGEQSPIETELNSLEAHAGTDGDIDLNEKDAISLTDVDTNDGSITLDAGGTITAHDVASSTDADANDISLHNTAGDILIDRIDAGTANGDVFLTSDAGRVEELGGGDTDVDLTADNAIINAHGSIGEQSPLETELNSLEAHAGTDGDIDLNEKDAISLTDVDTNDGSITLDAGGTITAHDVESVTDSDANDISIHNTAGDILVDRISAGPLAGDLTLTSDLGSINELAPEDPDNDLIADHAVLNAHQHIGGLAPLETEFNSLEAHSHFKGDIDLNEIDGIVLDTVTTFDGAIELDANGDIIAHHVESLFDDVTNSVTLHNTIGDILIDEVLAQREFSDVFLTSDAGGINSLAPGDEEIDIQGNNAVITAHHSIGGIEALDTELNRLTANVLTTGEINLHEASSITIDQMATADGKITLRVEENANVDRLTTGIDSQSNDIEISVGQNLNVNQIHSGVSSFTGRNPAAATTVSLDADRINEWKSDTGVDIRAGDLNLSTTRNVGAISDPLEISARRIDSASGFGANALNNYATGTVTVSNLSSTSGDIFFEQFNSTITFNSINAGNGNVTLFHNGTENMIIDNLIAKNGDVRLTVRDAGRLQLFNTDINGDGFFTADELDYFGGIQSILGTGTLSIQTDNPNNGIVVNPYTTLVDLVRILEYDIVRDRADGFANTYFSGNVLFNIPPTDLSSGRSGASGESSFEVDTPDTAVLLFADFIKGASSGVGSAPPAPTVTASEFVSSLGFSPASLTGLSGSLGDVFFSGILRMGEFESFFSAYFGYPVGLESLLPDLFENLLDTVEETEAENDGSADPIVQEAPAPGELVASRGEAPAIEAEWETEDETEPKASLLPIALAGFSHRLKKRLGRRK